MKTKRFFYLALSVLFATSFVACNNDDDVEYIDIEFENVDLGETGYVNNVNYVEDNLTFTNNYNASYGSWSGFSISSKTDMETAGYLNQYSIYGTSGVAGSSNFAVAYYSAYDETEPTFAFPDNIQHKIVSAYFSLTTYTYLAITEGNDGSGAVTAFTLENNDLYTVVATGYDAADTKTGEITIKLADYTGAEALLFDQWTKVDLSALGKVNKVKFMVTSTDTGDWGMNTPSYFAVDNIRFEK